MPRKQTHFIQSLSRGLSILQAFSSACPRLTLSQLAKKTGMNRTAVQRFTDTLVELGYLCRNSYKEFFLGPKVLSLGFAFLGASELTQMAESSLREFADRVGKTVNLAVLDETEIIFLFRHEVRRFLKFDLRAGSKLPSYCTASGKVLLASLADEELKSRLETMPFEAMTRHTLRDAEQLSTNLDSTRNRGYAICDQELSLGLYSIGVPLLNHEGRIKAAINLSMTSEESEDPEARTALTREVIHSGRSLSAAMGYSGAYPLIRAGLHEGGGL